ncbi:MAG TPA: endonuclease/exonuclease/phosphatase family protein [Capsulimonadaceae bacterium]|nr:endonuclease/exonuclease/phosphatase family protein [Capsulimonadaceae bacterium]
MASLCVRVATYNIRHGLGSDGRLDLARILPVLQESEADIVCLQEVDKGLPRSAFLNQAAWLAARLGFSFAFVSNFGLPIAGMGNALLSRWPFYSTSNTRLPFAGEPRGLLWIEVDHPEAGTLAFFCTHWGLSESQRLDQAQVCASDVMAAKIPAIFCGDLNATPDATEVSLLLRAAALRDAGPADSLTYPAHQPESKIDYILFTQHWKLNDVLVRSTLASDHLPIIAEFALVM